MEGHSIPNFLRFVRMDIRRQIRNVSELTRILYLVSALLLVRLSFQILLTPHVVVRKDRDPLFFLFLLNISLLFGISSSMIVLAVVNERIKLLCLGFNLTLCYFYFHLVLDITGDILFASCLTCFSFIFSVLALFLWGINKIVLPSLVWIAGKTNRALWFCLLKN